MTNANQNFPDCSLLINSEDRFYPALSSFVVNGDQRIDASSAQRLPVAVSQPSSWWAQAYQQGLPAVGGRYQFLRGAWLPGSPCAGWNASASWGACAPSTGEAC